MTQQPPPAGPADPPDGPAPPDLPDRVVRIYGELDLSTVPAFAGGFINFGYWSGLPGPADRPLTEADRVRSEEDLYRLVLGTFDRPQGRTALDVGCGRGLGCALALREFGLGTVIGLDAHPDQIARARKANAALLTASAAALRPAGVRPGRGPAHPAPRRRRRLPLLRRGGAALPRSGRFRPGGGAGAAPGGRLALTTFFARTRSAARELPALLPPYADGLDVPHVVDEVAGTLTAAGLREVRVRSIGDGVWESYDRYMAQQPELRDDWPRRYLTAYETGLLDYYLLTAGAG